MRIWSQFRRAQVSFEGQVIESVLNLSGSQSVGSARNNGGPPTTNPSSPKSPHSLQIQSLEAASSPRVILLQLLKKELELRKDLNQTADVGSNSVTFIVEDAVGPTAVEREVIVNGFFLNCKVLARVLIVTHFLQEVKTDYELGLRKRKGKGFGDWDILQKNLVFC